jgi:hypothetical protein
VIQRWLGFLVLRRAWRVLTDDSRPPRERLAREAKRLLVFAVVVLLVLAGIFLAVVYVLVRVVT